ncbi:MAG: excinuclease ABC subunit UvrA [Elusimicrobia bacterium]|nr:excinuclease ABC subunit UvrA [Elusimicrobiota bacterium]
MKEYITIKGAREHNLKNIDVKLPRNKFIVVSGLSGSGKSSLAFDTVYAEGQRRYVESLSSYARQFLGQMKKPRVDSITGIPPAVAIQQKGPGYNPRSTVGTLTEIYDYLRLLFARVGVPYCPDCERKIESQSSSEIVRQIIDTKKGKEVSVMAPAVRGRKGEYRELLERLRAEGFVTVKIDGKPYSLEEDISLDARKKHDISIVIDRIKVSGSDSNEERIADSVEIALKKGDGIVEVGVPGEKTELFSKHYACPVCGISIGDIEPRNFSFNSPYGACSECSGLGIRLTVDPELVVQDESLSINQGAIRPWSNPITTRRHQWKNSVRTYRYQMMEAVAKKMGFSLDTPFGKLPGKIRELLLYGSRDKFKFEFSMGEGGQNRYQKYSQFEGVVSELSRRYLQTDSEYVREMIQKEYMREHPCTGCGGRRLRRESLAVKVGGKNIADLSGMPVIRLGDFLEALDLTQHEMLIAGKVLDELISRIKFLINVGIDYVSLDRKASSLSSGEAERIRLATQIGSSLVGVAYILDEPTVGLHARDTRRLLNSLKRLKDLGNTLIVVEHDHQTLADCDYIVDLGPGAGINGGRIIFSGERKEFLKNKKSLTARYFTGDLRVSVPNRRRKAGGGKITLSGCTQFNLKNISVDFPLGIFICVTGVSGSGKSTLVEEILYKAVKKELAPSSPDIPGVFKAVTGAQNIRRIINIDQSPIGKTPRSNPATYTDVFTPVRDLFSKLPLSRSRGYTRGRFSFNVKEGTCVKCQGQGVIKLEMHFLPDIYVPCEACKGKKFTDATLDVKYKGRSIHDILEMSVDEALELFDKIPRIKNILDTLHDVGLGYIKLGQSSTTLSGGEAQRIKLARELSKKSGGGTLYILDEPTTGLHPHDIGYLLKVLHSLVDVGNTVVVIEHNMDVIYNADWIIDLGPEGGDRGGEVVTCGTPSQLMRFTASHTGRYLKKYVKNS